MATGEIQRLLELNSPIVLLLESVLAVIQPNAFALCVDIGFESTELRIVGIERLALDRVFDTPVDHIAQQRDPLKLDLILGVGFGMRVGGVGMTHVAAYSDRAAERLIVVKNALAFGDELIGLGFLDLVVARLKTRVSVALLNRQRGRRRGGGRDATPSEARWRRSYRLSSPEPHRSGWSSEIFSQVW
jgi:hypothetical protein